MKKKEIEAPLNNSTSNKLPAPQSSSNSMVDIVVRMHQDDTFANLKVSSFDLILSLEFLLKIAQFVTVPDDGKPVIAPTATTTAAAAAKRKMIMAFYQFFFGSHNILFRIISAAEVVPATETDPNKKITVLINIEQPDIILVEAMDDINCLALILNVGFVVFFHFKCNMEVYR